MFFQHTKQHSTQYIVHSTQYSPVVETRAARFITGQAVFKAVVCAFVFTIIFALSMLHSAVAAPNLEINYQGKLTDTTGQAVPDGEYNMRFWLLTGPSTATTSAEWSEELTGADTVTVTNGLFSVMLGSTSPLTNVDFDQTLYLGVEIGGTGSPTWDGEMSPRKVLGTVPSAFEAQQLGGIATSSFLRSDEADTISGNSVSSLLSVDQKGTGDVVTLLSDGNEVFTVSSAGNTGIGSSTPSSKLTVAGDAHLGGDLTATGTVQFSAITSGLLSADGSGNVTASSSLASSYIEDAFLRNDGDTTTGNLVFNDNVKALFGTGSDASIYYDGTDFQFDSQEVGTGDFIFNNGNVGIGTTSPSVRLNVIQSSSATLTDFTENLSNNGIAIGSSAGSGNFLPGFMWYSTSLNPEAPASGVWSELTGDGSKIHIGTSDSYATGITNQALTVNYNGNVGIGTTSPATMLELANDSNAPFIRLSNPDVTMADGADLGGIEFYNGDFTGGPGVTARIKGVTNPSDERTGELVFETASFWNPTEAMRIDKDGNVGIGTTSPSSKLSVQGDAGQTSPLFTVASSTSASLFSISSDTLGGFSVDYGAPATTTIQDSEVFAWTIATSTTADPIFRVDTSGTKPTTTIAGNFVVDSGSISHNAFSGVTSVDNLELGTLNFETDAGIVQWVDMPVATTTADLTRSYTAQLDGNSLLTVYGVTDGSGGVTDTAVGIGSTSPSARLVVQGEAGNTNDLFRVASSSGETYVSIGGDGQFVSTSTATSTFRNGVDIDSGCFAVNGTCIDPAAASTLAALTDTNVGSAASGTLLSYDAGTGTWYDRATNTLNIALSDTIGTLSVSRGGTGATSLSGLLLGNGTSAFTATNTLSSSYIEDAFLRNGGDTTTGNLVFNDNVKALFGTGSDASIYYDGTDFQFDSQEVGTGNFIFNNGNVGIGSSSPTAKLSVTEPLAVGNSALDVSGYLNPGEHVALIHALSSNPESVLRVTHSTNSYGNRSIAEFAASANTDGTGGVNILQLGENGDSAFGAVNVQSEIDTQVGLVVRGAASQSANLQEWQNSGSNVLSAIDSSGNLGLGTTSPSSKLDVWGNLTVGTSSTPTLFVDSSTENVGIGSTTPSALLSLGNATQFAPDVADSASAVAYNFDTENSLTTSGAKLFSFKNAGTEKAYIDKDGDIVINNSAGFRTESRETGLFFNGDNWQIKRTGSNLMTSGSSNTVNINDTLHVLTVQSGGVNNSGDQTLTLWIQTPPSSDQPTWPIKIEGQNAYSDATTNLVGGDLQFRAGAGAANSAGDAHGGDVYIAGGFGYGTGSHGNVILTATSSGSQFIGNVGIGTTSPWKKLSVDGDLSVTGAFFDSANSSAGTDGFVLQTTGAGTQWVATSSLGINGHDEVTLAGEDYLSLGGQQITANAIDADNLSATDFGDFTCNGTTCSFDTDTVATGEILDGTITEGDLNLNAPTDDYILVASSTAAGGFEWVATSSPRLGLSSGGGGAFTSSGGFTTLNNASDLVGIGTSSPYARLSVESSTGSETIFSVASSTLGSLFAIEASGDIEIDNGAFSYDYSTREVSIENLRLGPVNFDTNAGKVSWIDLVVDSTAATGTVQSYSAQLDSNNVLTIYGQADGSGGVNDLRVLIGTSTDTVLGSSNIPDYSMIIGNGALCVDNGNDNCDDAARSAGNIYAVNTSVTGIDVAENYPTKQGDLDAAEIVMLDPLEPVFVERYDVQNFEGDLGIVEEGSVAGESVSADGEGGATGSSTTASTTASTTIATTDLVSDNEASSTANGTSGASHLSNSDSAPGQGQGAAKGRKVRTNHSTQFTEDRNTPHLLGVVSTKPGLLLGGFAIERFEGVRQVPVALNGRVPVKVTNENGDIKVGDRITPSRTKPGYGMKADSNYNTVGVALEPFTAQGENATSTVLTFVDLESREITETVDLSGDYSSSTLLARDEGYLSALLSFFDSVGVFFGESVTIVRNLVASTFTVGSSAVPSGITLYDEETGDPYCVIVSNGELVHRAGECESTVSADTGTTTDTATDPAQNQNNSGQDDTSGGNPVSGSGSQGEPTTNGTSTGTTTDPVSGNEASSTANGTSGTSTGTSTDSGTANTGDATTTSSGGEATTTEPTPDTTPPEITLSGSTNIELTEGGAYSEPGYTATDDTDGDITDQVTVGGDAVDTSTPGTYTVTYNVTDSAGNAASEQTRTVTVVAAPEPEPTNTDTGTSSPSS